MDEHLLLIVAIGFLAQLVDGALSMAYGLTSTSLLISIGVPPAVASASVHLAETATTGVSGISHYFAGNINWRLVRQLAVAGTAGGIAGALFLSAGAGDLC